MSQNSEPRRLTLTQEVARRMHQVGGGMPEANPTEVRAKYEAMAKEAREATAERLQEYVDAVTAECFSKRHSGSRPPDSNGRGGAVCAQCRTQIRYMRTALKVVAP